MSLGDGATDLSAIMAESGGCGGGARVPLLDFRALTMSVFKSMTLDVSLGGEESVGERLI